MPKQLVIKGAQVLAPQIGYSQVPADMGYILSCSSELGEISSVEELVFLHDTPAYEALNAALNRNECLGDHWLRNTARSYLDSLPREGRLAWAFRTINTLESSLANLAGRMAHVLESKVSQDLGYSEREPQWFDHELASTPNQVFHVASDVTHSRAMDFLDEKFQGALQNMQDDLAKAREAYEWVTNPDTRDEAIHYIRTMFSGVVTRDLPVPELRYAPRGPRVVEEKKKLKSAQKAIKKLLRFTEGSAAGDNVRMLVSGESVELHHPDSAFRYKVQARKGDWLIAKTLTPGRHVPYELTICTRDGEPLSSLCVVFDQTPVLDQILALTMVVSSGEEWMLLEKANWYGINDASAIRAYIDKECPKLASLLRTENRGPYYEPKAGMKHSLLGGLDLSSHPMQRFQREVWHSFERPVSVWIEAKLQDVKDDIRQLAA